MLLLSCFHQSDATNIKVLVHLPSGVPDPSRSCPIPRGSIDTRLRVAADHSFHVYSWYSAIESMRWHVGQIYMDAYAKRQEWESRAVRLQRDIHSSSTIEKRVELLFTFLNEESKRKTQRELLLPILTDLQKSLRLPAKEAHDALSQMAFECHCLKYGLLKSDLPPLQTPEKLKELLETKGPLLVFMKLEFDFKDSIENKAAFLGKKFWIWPRGTQKREIAETQALIIVGIWLTAKGNMVCFANPSEPTEPSKDRKLYIVTYDKFASSLINTGSIYGYTSESVQLKKILYEPTVSK